MRVDAIGAAASGLHAAVAQLNAAANNVANLQTTKPMDGAAFQGDHPVLTEDPAGGVQVSGSAPAGTAEGVPVPQPDNPQADAEGRVRLPNIDVGGEMVQLMSAQHSAAANVHVMNKAVDAYRDLLAMTNLDRERQTAAPVRM
jgi:flagellar basal-body rod protein FlgC